VKFGEINSFLFAFFLTIITSHQPNNGDTMVIQWDNDGDTNRGKIKTTLTKGGVQPDFYGTCWLLKLQYRNNAPTMQIRCKNTWSVKPAPIITYPYLYLSMIRWPFDAKNLISAAISFANIIGSSPPKVQTDPMWNTKLWIKVPHQAQWSSVSPIVSPINSINQYVNQYYVTTILSSILTSITLW